MNEYDTKYTKNKKRCTTANTSLDIYESLVAGAALRWLDRGARALCLGVWEFWRELVHLLQQVAVNDITETQLMLIVLGLIDVVMISNLLLMVIVGGWETFVSRLALENHPDQPEWLSHVNAGVLKVKLATAIIGISSIHLLKTFINASQYDTKQLLWQTVIHLTFVLSAVAIAFTERLMREKEH